MAHVTTDRPDWEEAYWRGGTDEKLKAMMDRLSGVERKVDMLIGFRAWLLGMAAAVSALVTLAFQLGRLWLGR